MKKIISILLLSFVFTIFSQTVFTQSFPYHLYDPRTLAELNELNDKVTPPLKEDVTNLAISAKPFYSAIRLEYAGKSRKLSKHRTGLFKLWAESLNIKSNRGEFDLDNLLDKEFLFRECGKEHWITVQAAAANDFPKDMKEGDRITLYLMLVGGIETDNKWEHIYFANSFRNY